MTETDQEIALCEWAGWKRAAEYDWGNLAHWRNGTRVVTRGDLPDTNRLDVLHEVTMKAVEQGGWDFQQKFNHFLTEVAMRRREGSNVNQKLFWMSNATAAQRREALLRVIGKWKE